jgi:MFS family permease
MDLLGRIRDEMAFEGNIWKSYLYRFLMNFQLWWPIWVIYLQKERGLTLTQITVLDVPFFLLIVLAEVPTGAVADRWGRRYSLMLGALMFSIAVFVFGIAESYPLILLSYTAWGFGLTFQSGADTAILYDSLKAVGREDDFQKINSRLWAVTSTAVLVAILIGAPIAAATSFTVPIVASAVISLIAVPVAFSMHEPRHQRDDEHERYFQTVITGVREAWRAPALRYIILFSGILGAAVFAPMIFVQPFLDEHGVDTGNLGLWQAPLRGAGVIAALLVSQFVARVGQRASFFAMPLAIAIAMFALAGIDSLWVFGVFLAVGMVAGSMNPVLASYVNKRIPSERRATMLSVQSVVASLILAGVEPASGALADLVGLQGMFLAVGLMTVVIGGGTLLLWNAAEERDQRDEGGGAAPLRERAAEREPVAVS